MRLLSSVFDTNVHMLRIWTRSHDVIWWKVIWQILCSVLPRLKQILFHLNYLLAATALITLAHSFDHSSSMLLKLQKSFINIPSFLLCNCSFSFPPPTPSHMHFNHHYLHWKVTLNQATMLKQSTFCVRFHPLLSAAIAVTASLNLSRAHPSTLALADYSAISIVFVFMYLRICPVTTQWLHFLFLARIDQIHKDQKPSE